MQEHYCIFKGKSSLDFDLILEKCPDKISPKRRDEIVIIPGRHGNLTTTDGAFESYIRSAEFVVTNLRQIDNICEHFKGSGWLIFDDEPNRKYMARVANQLDFSRIIKDFKRFQVEFEVQPFGYDIDLYKLTKTAPFTLMNIGTVESEPIITIYGSGNVTLTINSKNVILTGISGSITLDSETKNAYSGATLLNNKMQGEFPILSLGENIFSWTGNVTKIDVQPNWRWV